MTLSLDPLLVFGRLYGAGQDDPVVYRGDRGVAEYVCHELGHWAALRWRRRKPMPLGGKSLSWAISRTLLAASPMQNVRHEAWAWAVEWHLCKIFGIAMKWRTLARHAKGQLGRDGELLVLCVMEDAVEIERDVYRATEWVFDSYREHRELA